MEAIPDDVVIGEEVLYQTLQDEVVLLNIKSQKYYGLNDVGARMWELLLEHRNVAKVADILSRTYDGEEAAIRADLNRLIEDLLKGGLLVPGH